MEQFKQLAMHIITTLDKDLYDQARVCGKIASILSVAKLATPEVGRQIEKNKGEFEFIKQTFDLSVEPAENTRPLQNVIQTLNGLCDWLLHHLTSRGQISFIHEELHELVSIAEQRMITLRSK